MSSQFRLDTWRVRGSGHWFIGVAGEAISAKDAVRFGTNGQIYRTDADAEAYMPCMGIALDVANAAEQSVSVLTRGFVEIPGNIWTAGAKLYVTTAPGALSHTAPTEAGDITQQVGFAINTTQIWFDPKGESIGVASGCPVLDGVTAYVGFDDCKEPFTNYFLCDGTADNVQIQAAIDYVAGLGGGKVSIARSRYLIGATLNFPSDGSKVILVGEGVGSTTLEMTAVVPLFNLSYDNCYQQVIKDMELDGNSVGTIAISVNRTGFANRYSGHIFGNLRIHGFTTGIHLLDAEDNTIEENYINSCTNPIIIDDAGGVNWIINSRVFGVLAAAQDIYVTGVGALVWFKNVITSRVHGDDCEGMIFEGCWFEQMAGELVNPCIQVGAVATACNIIYVSGCRLATNAPNCIKITNCKNIHVDSASNRYYLYTSRAVYIVGVTRYAPAAGVVTVNPMRCKIPAGTNLALGLNTFTFNNMNISRHSIVILTNLNVQGLTGLKFWARDSTVINQITVTVEDNAGRLLGDDLEFDLLIQS